MILLVILMVKRRACLGGKDNSVRRIALHVLDHNKAGTAQSNRFSAV